LIFHRLLRVSRIPVVSRFPVNHVSRYRNYGNPNLRLTHANIRSLRCSRIYFRLPKVSGCQSVWRSDSLMVGETFNQYCNLKIPHLKLPTLLNLLAICFLSIIR